MLCLKRGQRAPQLGIVLAGGLLDIGARGQRRDRIRRGQRIGGARIGKQQHAQFEPRFFGGQPRVGKFPLALLLLKLRLHHVGVGGLALLFALAGQRGKVGGFGAGALGNRQLVIGRDGAVVETGHRGHQAAAGDFQFRRGHRRGRIGAADAGYLASPMVSSTTPWLAYSRTALLAMNLGAGCAAAPWPAWF